MAEYPTEPKEKKNKKKIKHKKKPNLGKKKLYTLVFFAILAGKR